MKKSRLWEVKQTAKSYNEVIDGKKAGLFLQQKFTEHLLSAKCCFRGYSGE